MNRAFVTALHVTALQATALLVTVAASTPALGKQCVIAASPPYGHFERAQAQVAGLKKAGFASAAVYDSRDFSDLAYGQLAVIALITPDRKAAAAAVKALKKAKVKAYHRGCDPRAGITPLASKADIRPLPEAPATPLALDLTKPLTPGCHGWSRKQRVALCVVGRGSMQAEGAYYVAFPPTDVQVLIVRSEPGSQPDLLLTGAARAKVKKLIDRYQLTALPEPIGRTTFGVPAVRVHLARKKTGHEKTEVGSWDQFEETVTVRCGKDVNEVVSVANGNLKGTLATRYLGGAAGAAVLVQYTWTFALEGDFGGGTWAGVYPQSVCGPRPDAP